MAFCTTWGEICPTLARAFATSSYVLFSKLAAPFTVATRIGNQVGAPLIDVLHLAPLRIDGLAQR